jgi:hypothetical protein
MAKGEGRYAKKPDPASLQNPLEREAETKAEATAGGERKDTPEMMKTLGREDAAPIANGVLSESFKRHLNERRQMHTRHEREHREMSDRHMRELGGTLSQSDIVNTSGVGGMGGEAAG